MSETTLVMSVTAGIIVVMFAWVPLLHVFCPRCGRYFGRLRLGRTKAETDDDVVRRGDEAA